MSFIKTTEQSSKHDNLENKSISEILLEINNEDKTVPFAIEKALPQINNLTTKASEIINNGGRLFYMGAGTSGRLGIVDASECPPTFGVPDNVVIGIIAGGDSAIRNAVEFAEDNTKQGWEDLKKHQIGINDFVIGIAASGTTPYVIGALNKCNTLGINTGCITCNVGSPLANSAKYPIEVVVGPEYVTGSSRMKAGTAQKLVLNMISTTVMIQLGRIKGNKMVDMQLSNNKLVERGTKMIAEALNVSIDEASALLNKYKNVRVAIENYNHG
ncbi:N-acetylmuramic acid 6-phosphate etherase [Patiriisocius marinus]|uniref:N-acetylmuramic acid 6-phosphate etherase n=1 Tax=Patiriisocius marinus TaxID=1397112 RepID=A0A5J4IS75_9FLAO|nr:N-acetylmuramic acid 6-phosphate etherase [Patiriisocius marinus]GER60825.1 N-acetylmuramic acid 6-phosphate etherase [Patiriisocius marinus]